MPFLRVFVLLLLLVSAGAFACFAVTGQERFKHFGLVVLKWTLVGAFVFFGVLILERIALPAHLACLGQLIRHQLAQLFQSKRRQGPAVDKILRRLRDA